MSSTDDSTSIQTGLKLDALAEPTEPIQIRVQRAELERLIVRALDARLQALRGADLVVSEDIPMARDPERKRQLLSGRDQAVAYWNAHTLISVLGAIEGHIEAIGQDMREMVIQSHKEKHLELAKQTRKRNGQLRREGHLPETAYPVLTNFSRKLADWFLSDPQKRLPHDMATADKWEDSLRRIYLAPIPGRPVPDDLRATVNELGELRHVILHRMGRVDEKALRRIMEGPWNEVDQEIRVTSELYRRYIAALMAYAYEIHDRVYNLLGLPVLHDITNWRQMVPVGG